MYPTLTVWHLQKKIGQVRKNCVPHRMQTSPLLGSDIGLLGHLWSQMMLLCHSWGWHPTQTASHIHIRHKQSVWADWYAVHWHILAVLHSFTHSNRLRFWGSGSLVVVESKWCHYNMFEADSHLNLLPPSILDIYKVFEHIDMLSIGIW